MTGRGKSTMLGALRALFGAAFVADVPAGGGRRRQVGDADPQFIADCLRLFDFGLDTRDIALQLRERECVVAYCVSLGRDRRLEG